MLVKACQTSSLLLFKFWQGLYLLMSSYNLIYTMNFTMKYDIVPFSHILVHSKFRIFGLAEAQILSEPNLISTNERRDNIRPMRNGYYFPISGSHLRPAVYLGDFSFPFPYVLCDLQLSTKIHPTASCSICNLHLYAAVLASASCVMFADIVLSEGLFHPHMARLRLHLLHIESSYQTFMNVILQGYR